MNPLPPLNQILFGPPGTGKTYETINAALEILAPEFIAANRDDRAAVKGHFDSLVAAGHVRFVTFHQSFSYEDFVEGLRAENTEDGQLTYSVVDGVFKSLCEAASAQVTKQAEAPLDLKGRTVWKMSLGNTLGSDAYIFDECIDKGYALLGYGGLVDFSGSKTRDDIIKRFQDAGTAVAKDAYEVTAVTTFVIKMKAGDLVVVTDGNMKFRAIGEITGAYQSIKRDEQGDTYGQCRTVRWLRVYKPSLPFDQLMTKQFSQRTLYELSPGSMDMEKLEALLQMKSPSAGTRAPSDVPYRVGEVFGRAYSVTKASADVLELKKPNGNELAFSMRMLKLLADYVRRGDLTIEDIKEKRVFEKVPESSLEPYLVNGYNNILPALVERLTGIRPTSSVDDAGPPPQGAKVLIIDEINRGNVSRVLGELITLIEPSKRAGNAEALEVTLPYSKERFSVPANLYLIGTMNTADRSLAGLDLALRRRFSFREMPPRPDLLDEVDISGVNVGAMLRVMNERIELLLDRDHCIGHAYFMSLRDTPTIEALGEVFRSKLIPLLQEYFFEDWQRIQWVLNDHRKAQAHRFIQKPASNIAQLFGEGVSVTDQNQRWVVNEAAFLLAEAYAGVIELVGAMAE
ncbi:5-methylcytosine-specific restriction protein B [Cupriavidus phytorum]|uniref:5-methylcytosine-specific restriction protein B n=1 Tax=Cupriavidus phytorum TaxID=3024399 RepID=A0A2W7QN98_9BURK|nr:AAA family ATPase [Cupriavidus alkaliphilus]PZX25395.1 5-methylcytosine-specific restriction protein B [Cupriavidus alkaliphilus]